MGKNEETLVAQRNQFMGMGAPKQKGISKPTNGNNMNSPRSKEQGKQIRQYQLTQRHYLDENTAQQDEKPQVMGYTGGKSQFSSQFTQNQSRRPLQDITNISSSKQSNKKSSLNDSTSTKQTRHFVKNKISKDEQNQHIFDINQTYLTFLNNSAMKQFKVLLYVDRELGIPSEYVDKLQDHSIDNDVATDDEQIYSAIKKLTSALEEEVYMNKDLEEELLEQIMYEEIEQWESQEEVRKQQQKQQGLLEQEMLLKNKQIIDTKSKQPLESLFEKVYVKYQSICKKPYTIKSHERLLYKTIEKTIPKYREYFKTQSYQYKQYIQKRQQKAKQQQQLQQQELNNSNVVSSIMNVKQINSSSSSQTMSDQISNISTQPSQPGDSYIANKINNDIESDNNQSNSNNFEVLSDVSSLHKISTSNLIDSI